MGCKELGGWLGLDEQQVGGGETAVGSGTPWTRSVALCWPEAFHDATAGAWSSCLIGPSVPAVWFSQPLWEEGVSLGLFTDRKTEAWGH